MNVDSFKNLTKYLINSIDQSITLSFEEIDEIIHDTLPDEAKSKPSWWYNKQSNPHAHYWIEAGYKTYDCKNIQARGNVCFIKMDGKKKNDNNNEKEQHLDLVGKWIAGISNGIAIVFSILSPLTPNAPIWERFLLFVLLVVFDLFFYLPLIKNKLSTLIRCTIISISFLSIGFLIGHLIINEIIIDRNSDKTLSVTLLPLEYKPLPIKIADVYGQVDFYCSDMPPIIDFVLNNQADTVATVTSITVGVLDYEEFSAEEILEHCWIDDEPSEIILKREDVLLRENTSESKSNHKVDFTYIASEVYHDRNNQETYEFDNGTIIKDARFPVYRYSYFRFQPEIKDGGHYVINLSINYSNAEGEQKCESEKIDFYYLEETINDILNDNTDSIEHFLKLGDAFYCRGNYNKALEYLENALTVCVKNLGEDHPKVATIYNNIGVLYRNQGKYEEALTYNKKALSIRVKALGKDHPSTAITYNNMAYVYCEQGMYKEALKYYEKALEIRESMLGKDHPDTARTYNNLAVCYDEQGNYEEAIRYYKLTIPIFEKKLGEEHPETAMAYNNLATVYRAQGNDDEALKYYKKSKKIQEKILGKEHPDTATTYNNIAVLYSFQKNYQEALKYYGMALPIFEKELGYYHPDTATMYNNIAANYELQGDYAKALEFYGKALIIFEDELGKEHPKTVGAYNNLGTLFYYMQDYENARSFLQKAYDANLKTLGKDHPNTKDSKYNLDRVLEKLGEH